MTLFAIIALCSSLVSSFAEAQSIPFIHHSDLGDAYYFNVLKPAGDSPAAKPALNLFLHGAGSVGDFGELDVKMTYNGPGRRIKEYYDGNITAASKLVAEEFLTVLPIHPNDTIYPAVPEWDLGRVKAVLDFVQQNYDYDEDRVYLTGYSMGARDGWKMALAYPTSFAAVALSAGEPDNTTDFRPLLNIPFRHYAGTKDYEGASNVGRANQTQHLIEAIGGTKAVLTIIDGPDPAISPAHNQMANVPFFEDHFNWLLSKSFSGAASANTAPAVQPSAGSSTGGSQTSIDNENSAASTLRLEKHFHGLLIFVAVKLLM
ncbi:alpha/beta-hydrolase [Atractiella rhizophila]|nr:alpha/beta-hydrolase [Atractiella rhizophila]